MFKKNLLELSHTVTKLEQLSAEDEPISMGTGFFYQMEFDNNAVPLLITNKHVVDAKNTLRMKFARSAEDGSRALDSGIEVTISPGELPIIYHPDPEVNLAAIPYNSITVASQLAGVPPMHVLAFSKNMIPPNHVVSALHAGSNTLMIGHPRGLIDETNNLPIVRSGILATHFHTDFNGKREFLIDMATFPGSSGSPVFAVFDGIQPPETGPATFDGSLKFWLIGILWGVSNYSVNGEATVEEIPTQLSLSTTTVIPMGIGHCIKSNRLEELRPLVKDPVKKQQNNV